MTEYGGRNDGDLSNMGCLAVAISAFLAVMLAAATLLLNPTIAAQHGEYNHD